MTPDLKGEDGVRRGILEGERTTDEPALTTVTGAPVAVFLAESFLNKGLHRKVEIAMGSHVLQQNFGKAEKVSNLI